MGKLYSFDVTIECQGTTDPDYARFYNENDIGKQRTMRIDIEFFNHGGFHYGNGYSMLVIIDNNIHHNDQLYDLRYDETFDIDNAKDYAIAHIKNNWSGEKGSWKAIEIKEIERENEKEKKAKEEPVKNYGIDDGILGRVFEDKDEIER